MFLLLPSPARAGIEPTDSEVLGSPASPRNPKQPFQGRGDGGVILSPLHTPNPLDRPWPGRIYRDSCCLVWPVDIVQGSPSGVSGTRNTEVAVNGFIGNLYNLAVANLPLKTTVLNKFAHKNFNLTQNFSV